MGKFALLAVAQSLTRGLTKPQNEVQYKRTER
jgi:hypothetical protein